MPSLAGHLQLRAAPPHQGWASLPLTQLAVGPVAIASQVLVTHCGATAHLDLASSCQSRVRV